MLKTVFLDCYKIDSRMISCFHFVQEEYKPAPKKRTSTDSAASKNKRKSSKAVSDTSSSSEEDQVEENVRRVPV